MRKLSPGTVCLIRTTQCPEHAGKVVTVAEWMNDVPGYRCEPDLLDSRDGLLINWARESLVPLRGGSGRDEMLRIVGKPQEVASA